jgi:Holliday junction DNA helicase RuvA
MIGSLRGKLVDKRPNHALIDVGGVGYQVQIPLSTFAGLTALHDETTLLIHTHVREDQFSLYGFLTAREKQCFELLISASGVGPALALKILSGMGVEDLVPAIRKGDLAQLVLIPGVGKKTAERIVVELRDKLAVIEVRETGKVGLPSRPEAEAQVKSAVANLGYEPRAIEGAMEKLGAKAGTDFDTLLHDVLQELGKRAMHKRHRAPAAAGGTSPRAVK